MSQAPKKPAKEEVNYTKWLALLVTAKAVIILVAVAIILFFKAVL